MKPCICFAALIGSAFFMLPIDASAARCPKGTVLYRSEGVCITKSSAARIGIYRPRVAKASLRHRYKRAKPAKASPVMRAAAPAPVVAETGAFPTMQRTPMWDSMDPAQIAASPFGSLIALPESPAVWAARNASTFGEN